MYVSFEKLPEEKKAAILQICIEEFASKGYDNTSTDVITNRAGISKGILFHYFKSKKNLYLFVVQHSTQLLSQKTSELFREDEEYDFFDRIRHIIEVKQKITEQYYEETKLVMAAFLNPSQSVKKEMEAMYLRYREGYEDPAVLGMLLRQELLDKDMLRDEIQAERVIQFTYMIIEHISDRLLKNHYYLSTGLFDHQLMMKDLNEYFDILKHGIYK